MSRRIAVALAATIGAGVLMSTAAEARPDVVGFRGDYSPGTIVVKTNERRLYLVVDPDHAVRYPVGVGRAGKQWAGVTRIDGKYRNPAWSPPAEVKHDKPNMPDVIPGGSPRNPMGVAAMTLAGGEYAIHGTNVPNSVGGFVSYGCIRMLNPDITDLYSRVSVGTRVVVMPSFSGLSHPLLAGSPTKNAAPAISRPATEPRLQSSVAPSAFLYQATAAGASDTASMREMVMLLFII